MNAIARSEPERFWKAKDVAQFLSVSEKWVYKHAAAGTLPNSRFGSNLRFDPVAIRAYAERCSRGANTMGKVIPFRPGA
ncbi:MAG: helix-turn-helix domain-containing protein [Archangium sp.]|nr:helix-turn-helix domain-containing protein [Archangium sp.]